MEIAVGMHQSQGKREYQQDAMSIKTFGSIGVLAILADGMGGYKGGEIASQLVSENFREFSIEGDDIGESLKKYLLQGNAAIHQYKLRNPDVKNMGTTAIAFFMTDKTCQWVSVGDSPLYLIRNRSTIRRINQNHSVAGLLDLQAEKGEITREEALASGQRHMLTSAISGEDIPQMDLSSIWSVGRDDIFLLASDGIETINEQRILEIIQQNVPIATQENMQKACESLVGEVISIGTKNQDNVTVILLSKVEDDEPKTYAYKPASKVRSSRLIIAIAVLGLLAILFALYFFVDIDKEEAKEIPQSKSTQVKNDALPGKSVIKKVDKKDKTLHKTSKELLILEKDQVIEGELEKNTTSKILPIRKEDSRSLKKMEIFLVPEEQNKVQETLPQINKVMDSKDKDEEESKPKITIELNDVIGSTITHEEDITKPF